MPESRFNLEPKDRFPWPEDLKRLIRSGGTRNTEVHLDWIAVKGNDETIAEGFKDTADQQVERLERASVYRHPDRFFFPVAFLYRHALELRLKSLLTYAGLAAANEWAMGSHRLLPLWEPLEKLASQWPAASKDDLKAMRSIIDELEELDPDGFGLRYARSKKGAAYLAGAPDRIDLAGMRDTFDQLWYHLGIIFYGIELHEHDDY